MDGKIELYYNNIKKIDNVITNLTNKTTEIDSKIDMLKKKKNLKLEDATQLLKFQNEIIIEETKHLKNLKLILSDNVKTQLYILSENISMLVISILNIYKDIQDNNSINNINIIVQMTNKNDNITKIISDIMTNMNYINDMLVKFKTFNMNLSSDMFNNNFHCNTLKTDMENTYNHINTEYLKYLNDLDTRINYFMEFSNKISEYLNNMIISDFYAKMKPESISV
jgi:hypothetical protein